MTTLLSADKHQRGLQYFREGKLEEALQLLEESIAECETGERWNDWGAVQVAAHNLGDAEKALRRALRLEPDNFLAAANLGAVLASLGKNEEAIPLLERSQPGLGAEEQAIVDQLLLQCRGKLERGAPASSTAVEDPSPLITQILSMQTTALNSVVLRLIAAEEALDRLIQLIARTQLREALQQGNEVIPAIHGSELICGTAEMKLLALDASIENVSVLELKLILHLLRSGKARAAFEIGTSDGRTTLNLAANSPEDTRIYTLDLPRERLGARFHGTVFASKISQFIGETSEFDFSPFFNLMDFIFIDAGHDYQHVRNDSLTALKLLREGKGTIVWHDYSPSWSGVVEALHELFLTEPRLRGMRHIEGTTLAYAQVG